MDDEPGTARSAAHAPPGPWNHNNHYHRVILDAVPAGCRDALDVGCGTGTLTRRLRAVVPHVSGIDRDERSIEHARAHPGAADIGYLLGDFLTIPLEPESLDLVTSIAAVHHMDAGTALRRMAGLLRPGGVLAIVGLARGARPARRRTSRRSPGRRHSPTRPCGAWPRGSCPAPGSAVTCAGGTRWSGPSRDTARPNETAAAWERRR